MSAPHAPNESDRFACPACGGELHGFERFCPACATPLTVAAGDPTHAYVVSDRERAAKQFHDVSESFADLFEVKSVLGGGRFTVVYLARDKRRDCLIALKILKPELIDTAHGQRFLREIEITRSLHHPGVRMVFDAGTMQSTNDEFTEYVYFTLEYIPGETLRALLKREHQLSIPEALRITAAVAEALNYAHERHVIHRDIKPEKIFLTADGRVLLSDFGVARGVESSTSTRLTMDGFVIGTVTYLSPESIRAERLDSRSDQYALACVLFEMIAGRPPFVGDTQAVLLLHLNDAPPRIESVRTTTPRHVSTAITRGLAKIPSDRYANLSEFRNAITGEHAHTRHSIWGPVPSPVDESSCFVIMPFSAIPGVQEVYRDHVEPTIRACGLRPQRADDIFGHHAIVLDIWRAIAQARLLVADLTGRNPNVFYELGMAHAIGKDVIMLTQNSDDVPFDLKHLRYIAYQYSPRGVKDLERTLRGTIEAALQGDHLSNADHRPA